MNGTARALWTVAPGRCELREEPLPAPGPGEVRVRALASGVSRGTERLVLHGRVPPSQHVAMAGPRMGGAFPFPVKYGYCAVGVVESGDGLPPGTRVFCLHPHQDRFVVPAAACTVIPDDLPDARAVLAANTETAINVVWDARPMLGERVLVIGAGVVGLLCARLLRGMPAIDLALCDADPRRAAVAARLGLHVLAPAEAPGGRDLIVHCSGNPAGLRAALGLAGFEGRIVEASWHGAATVSLPLGEDFHSKRLRIVSSQVGAVSPAMRGRRAHADRMALALAILAADPALDALCDPVVPFADLPRALPALLDPPPDAPPPLCPVVLY